MANPRFVAMALPIRLVPPCFSRYQPGEGYGMHSDRGLFQFSANGLPFYVRSDLAGTLFLNAPEEYDGGELTIQDKFGLTKVKLPAGDAVLYPASSEHYVAPITTCGQRQVSFFLDLKHRAPGRVPHASGLSPRYRHSGIAGGGLPDSRPSASWFRCIKTCCAPGRKSET